MAKARSPFLFNRDLGTFNSFWFDDLKHLADMVTSSDKNLNEKNKKKMLSNNITHEKKQIASLT